MARIAGVNIPNHKHTVIGLTSIFGIGINRARKICQAATVPESKKVKDLTDGDLEKIREQVGLFATEGDLRREVTMNIKRLMDLGAIVKVYQFVGNVLKQMHERVKALVRPALL